MKYCISMCFFLLIAKFAFSQEDTIYTNNGKFDKKSKTYITEMGMIFRKGDNVIIGNGSDVGGKYKYITTASVAVGVIPLSGGWKGSKFLVKEIILNGSKKRGYIPTLKLGGGNIANYFCAVDAAIDANEIEIPDQYRRKPAQRVIVENGVSVADELKKLKALLDEGVITQEEYNKQKQKLLNQ